MTVLDITTTTIESPIGPLRLAAQRGAIVRIDMAEERHPPRGVETWRRDDGGFDDAVAQLHAYFVGELTAFDLPIRLVGTDFQRRVWEALRQIPYATTINYSDLAAEIGKPTARRAAGLANGRNPVSIIVPCHRVIGKNGTLVGYGGGLERKAWLLGHEAKTAETARTR